MRERPRLIVTWDWTRSRRPWQRVLWRAYKTAKGGYALWFGVASVTVRVERA